MTSAALPAARAHAAFLATVIALGSAAGASAADSSKGPVVFRPEPLRVEAGGQGTLTVTVTILAGRTLLAEPSPNNYSTPVTLILSAAEGVAPLQPEYPEGKQFDEEGGFSYFAYVDTVRIKVPIKVAAGTAPGPRVLKGNLRYQAIHEGLFAKTAVLPVEVSITVTAPKAEKPKSAVKPAAGAEGKPVAASGRR